MPLVTLKNISKNFGETHALRGANLETRLGEIHAIVGENGSGKSTMAKIISGVIVPDAGSVEVLGVHPKNPNDAIAAGVSTIFQEIMLAEDLTVYENTFAGSDSLWTKKYSVAEKRKITGEILGRLVGEPVNPDAIVRTLPLNIKQWIVIARAILNRPKVLIFDESSAALDLEATNRLHDEMRKLRDDGSCVILVTHRIAELVKITDSATVLRDGETVGRLSKEEITEENILKMMSASSSAEASTQARKVISTEQKPVLFVEGCKVTPDAKPFDFKVHAGEIVGIAGLDGAGQTEFLRQLSCIEAPAAGQVMVCDSSVETHELASLAEAEDAGITYVSGDRKLEGIFPNLSVFENFGVALMDRLTRRSGVIARDLIGAKLDVEMERLAIKLGHKSDKISTLSGGNQQKVLIARAFARSPRVIVLNDPARGVDVGTKQDLYKHLREFASNGGAVVYLSSEIEEFYNFAHRADVFVNKTIFASFKEQDINEDHVLSAMFGRTGHIEFDAQVEATVR
ncbi:sugar ABC transporter ATP-binding protein [Hoeflea prorocentri]|uniref:Sugar ABC transporter ATP-binding protein n=1 Tax=Hoeflea prorocentri TaxID=1922333 RepID=A0A9X3ZGC7_9HYPH|nr:sugar ABC transporter ATP-binding protein [Hoeflea prorocentri]MCY6379651.1 sugar ABC transporter ATP-binding protein [Hoeflea prorocentri]MDA5397451.1 sugar ABC transporter ATP-binding protein [Hoeflea prorocentri]